MGTGWDVTELISQLEQEGYHCLKTIDGKLCGLFRFIFTTGLVVGLDSVGYSYRYCYESYADAKEALEKYDSLELLPPGNWIKRKGIGEDLSNQNYNKD
jgi:hypothetical protein